MPISLNEGWPPVAITWDGELEDWDGHKLQISLFVYCKRNHPFRYDRIQRCIRIRSQHLLFLQLRAVIHCGTEVFCKLVNHLLREDSVHALVRQQ